MKKRGLKKPGRIKLRCCKCEKEFSTHSSNRKHCHQCIPKCREVHLFKGIFSKRVKLNETELTAVKMEEKAIEDRKEEKSEERKEKLKAKAKAIVAAAKEEEAKEKQDEQERKAYAEVKNAPQPKFG